MVVQDRFLVADRTVQSPDKSWEETAPESGERTPLYADYFDKCFMLLKNVCPKE